MAQAINWPVNPSIGDSFTSSYGRIWWWDGCAWAGTCCPPSTECDPFAEGLRILFSFGVEEDLSLGLLLNYVPQEDGSFVSAISATGEDLPDFIKVLTTLEISFNEGLNRWEIISTVEGEELLAWSDSLVGEWTIPTEFEGEQISVTSKCGYTDNICATGQLEGKNQNVTYIPVFFNPTTEDIDNLGDFYLQFTGGESFGVIAYDSGEWFLFYDLDDDESPSDFFGSIEGTSNTLPTGEWNLVPDNTDLISFTTTSGPNCSYD
jgi:hypothetical protein